LIFTSSVTATDLYARENDFEDDGEEDDDDDDDAPEVDIKNFRPPKTTASFGFNRGRSSPSTRKAMGASKASSTKVFMCTNCGAETVQWMGRCPTCKEWNTLQEFSVQRSNTPNNKPRPLFGSSSSIHSGSAASRGTTWLDGINDEDYEKPTSIDNIDMKSDDSKRILIPDDNELNMVLGGGLLKGSLILLGGDPGVGKSTLALQIAAQIATTSTSPVGVGMGEIPTAIQGPVWYVSGEETLQQIASRAERLKLSTLSQLYLLAETSIERIANQVVFLLDYETSEPPEQYPPSFIVIDSIQTMMSEEVPGSPGGVTQVRECMALLLRLAKSTKIPILCIGHVTKTGDVAGPRMVEHMVDVSYWTTINAFAIQASTMPWRSLLIDF
jgi:DNA repair protein RadA/Sms